MFQAQETVSAKCGYGPSIGRIAGSALWLSEGTGRVRDEVWLEGHLFHGNAGTLRLRSVH